MFSRQRRLHPPSIDDSKGICSILCGNIFAGSVQRTYFVINTRIKLLQVLSIRKRSQKIITVSGIPVFVQRLITP